MILHFQLNTIASISSSHSSLKCDLRVSYCRLPSSWVRSWVEKRGSFLPHCVRCCRHCYLDGCQLWHCGTCTGRSCVRSCVRSSSAPFVSEVLWVCASVNCYTYRNAYPWTSCQHECSNPSSNSEHLLSACRCLHALVIIKAFLLELGCWSGKLLFFKGHLLFAEE